ncbi:uncharacterized protein BP5553_04549 [Venustampulla echinocandica]|uniref:Uncharacterized protein n=1 Tax=Venustampulla echinocandica TaxID=2656787 RepID=A0A370TNL3_9HELO|nr:uncharacterized protein BP5553_04549 [Venustampulla echinocandica]RDL37116.1 hypothetical protein BP5553_04549 [Venustampulla echinocandica]
MFLSQNTSPELPTMLLISSTGKLLSSCSPLPASTLRTQSTVASTLWNLHHPDPDRDPHQSAGNNHVSSPQSVSSQATTEGPSSPAPSGASTTNGSDLNSITIQISHGIMVIRSLSCGLLFVAIGPSSVPTTITALPDLSSLAPHTPRVASSHTSPPSSPAPQQESHEAIPENDMSGSAVAATGSGFPSQVGSVRSSVARASKKANLMAIKRQAEEVSRWLDDRLQGFTLGSGEGR